MIFQYLKNVHTPMAKNKSMIAYFNQKFQAKSALAFILVMWKFFEYKRKNYFLLFSAIHYNDLIKSNNITCIFLFPIFSISFLITTY